MARRRPTYSPEFKAEAVRLVRTSSDAVSKIARDLGVQPGTLRLWVDATRPPAAEPLTTDERTELKQLRRDIRRVREERDILKKPRPSLPSRANNVRVHLGGEGPAPRAHAV